MDRSIALLPNEQALAARAKAEPEAFAAIYDHYFPRVYNFVRYRVQDAQTADDITAQVFEKALTGIDRYLPMQGSLGAWLFGNGRRIMWSSTWLVAFANFGYHWYLKIEKKRFHSRRALRQNLTLRILPSLLVISILLAITGCSSPVVSNPVATVSTSKATRTPTPARSPTAQVTPTTPVSSDPIADAQSRLLTEVPPRIHGSYPSPDGIWEAQVIIYDCTSIDPEAPGGNSLEQLVLIRLTDSTRIIVDSQFIYCGGLGASGLEGRFWTNDSKFFFYTSAREGVPDGCGFWIPPLLRVGIPDQKPTRFGASVISPDGKMIAAWVSGQLEIWETSGGQIALVHNPVSGAIPGPIAWSPDNRSVAYLLNENQCMTGETYLFTMALTDLEPVLVLTSEDPGFVDTSWDDLNNLTLFDRESNSWSFNLMTEQLTGPSN